MKRTFSKGLGVFWILLSLLVCVAPPVQAQDLNKLATDLAARIRAAKHDRITVLDFMDLDKKPNKLGKFLAQKLQSALAEPERGLEVVDQSQLPQLFEQVKLLDEGLLDPATRRELGKITSTEVVIIGTVMVSSLSVKLDVKGIDLQTAKQVAGGSASLTRIGVVERLASASTEDESEEASAGEDTDRRESSPRKTEISKGPSRSRHDQGVLFELDGCSSSGDSLTCSVTVTSEGRDRWLAIGFESRAWNGLGDEFEPNDVVISNSSFRPDCAAKQILKNVPTNLSLTFPQFGDASTVERLRLFWKEDDACWSHLRPVDFEKIALSGDTDFSSPRNGNAYSDRGQGNSGKSKGKGGLLGRLSNIVLDKLESTATEIIDKKAKKLVGDDKEEEKKPPQK